MSQWRHITIERLEVCNFKRFYGTHYLDLRPADNTKPLILIGGENGRGKTSIHEAINYALYEDDDLPGITTRPNYLRAISDRLNRRALDEGKTNYGVILDLILSTGSADRRFRIERKWEVNLAERRVTRPVLTITENGRPLDWLDQDSPEPMQDFLRSTLPPRIAPFFFFDGERIQEFADESDHEQRMVEAIEDILHINVYKALRSDVKKYVIDYIETNEIARTETDDFFALQQDAERIEADLEKKTDRQLEIDREVEETSKDRKRLDEELRRIASPHASKRDELLADRSRLEQEIDQVKAALQKAFEPLPILLAGPLANELEATLREEQAHPVTTEALARLRQQVQTLHDALFANSAPHPEVPLTAGQGSFYSDLYCRNAEQVFGLNAIVERARIHDIAEGERQRILHRLAEVRQFAMVLRDEVNRRERLFNEHRDVENKLQSTSDDAIVERLLRENREAAEKIGRLNQEHRTLEGEIQRLRADVAARQRQIEERQRTRQATTEAKRAVKLGQEVRRVLDAFIRDLASEKLKTLKSRFEEMYSLLRKPEDPWRTVEVDPETWQIILKDDRGRPLERRVFSAGMKEIYALSLLWGLSRASGRELPMVIDTPVGRLDTTNRRALFEKYLPNAGHQVIVLSTDTEVDVQWAQRLAPYVSRQYRLDYDSANDTTVIRPGYFF